MRTNLVAGLCCAVVAGLAGCGGDDDSADNSGSAAEKPSTTGKVAGHGAVLACLKREGVEAEDQSNSSGKKIGIDYAAGRAVISFEKTAEDAATYASVAESNGETAVAKGTVAITLPDDPEAESAKATVEGCVESP